MQQLRRRFASCALALTVLQAALVFAAPLSLCCPSRTAAQAVQADKDCCPAGSHPPGECPLHARFRNASKSASQSGGRVACRMQCDAPHGAGYVLGAIGVLPAPLSASVPVVQAHALAVVELAPTVRSTIPDSPPPRLL